MFVCEIYSTLVYVLQSSFFEKTTSNLPKFCVPRNWKRDPRYVCLIENNFLKQNWDNDIISVLEICVIDVGDFLWYLGACHNVEITFLEKVGEEDAGSTMEKRLILAEDIFGDGAGSDHRGHHYRLRLTGPVTLCYVHGNMSYFKQLSIKTVDFRIQNRLFTTRICIFPHKLFKYKSIMFLYITLAWRIEVMSEYFAVASVISCASSCFSGHRTFWKEFIKQIKRRETSS